MKELDTFVMRIGDKKFHGGDWPDIADITVYASLSSRNNSKFWVDFKEFAFKGRLNKWYWDMKKNCDFKDAENVTIALQDSLEES